MARSTRHGRRETAFVVALWDIQAGICFHCGLPMLRGTAMRLDRGLGWTREHLVARDGQGGPRSQESVLAHARCNGARNNTALAPADLARGQEIYRQAAELAASRDPGSRTLHPARRSRRLSLEPTGPLATIGDRWPEKQD